MLQLDRAELAGQGSAIIELKQGKETTLLTKNQAISKKIPPSWRIQSLPAFACRVYPRASPQLLLPPPRFSPEKIAADKFRLTALDYLHSFCCVGEKKRVILHILLLVT